MTERVERDAWRHVVDTLVKDGALKAEGTYHRPHPARAADGDVDEHLRADQEAVRQAQQIMEQGHPAEEG